MSLVKKFLQMPLKLQINLFLVAVYILTIGLIFAFSQSITSMHFQYIKDKKKEYFLTMERNIIESDIYFLNMVLLQYENIIKFFNSEIYNYNYNETIIKYFLEQNQMPEEVRNGNIHVFNSISELYSYPDYNESISDNERKIYIYCDSNNQQINQNIIKLIAANSLSYLNHNQCIRNFKIPFYGDVHLMGEYIIFLKNYDTLFSINNTKIKEVLQKYGSITNLAREMNSKIEEDYLYHEKYFKDYSDNKIKLMELMYNKTYLIFDNYNSINDTLEKVDYIYNQSIHFQTINFEDDFTLFFNNWNSNKSRIIGGNNIMDDYLERILFEVFKKIDIITLPMNNVTNKFISRNLCYFFLLKQIYFLTIQTDYSYDKNLIEKIYESIQNKDIADINECKLDKYYNDISEKMNMREELFHFFDLKSIYDTYAYRLIKDDKYSYMLAMKTIYPNLESLKLFYPNYFVFHQLEFYSFKIGANISRIIASSHEFVNNVNYLIIITLWFFWLFISIFFYLILNNVVPKITDPIVRLTQIINLTANDLKKENIFEYELDDDINKFFKLCKNLIDGEMINNDLTINEILEDKSLDGASNNNMIINNKMILELIENQKNLNNNDKDIFILKEGNFKDKKNKDLKSPRSRKRNFNGLNNLDVIKLISLNDGENSEKNTQKNKKDKLDNIDMYSQVDEDDLEMNNLKLYEDLIKIADFVFYGKEREKINKMRKNIDKASSLSKKSKTENNFKIIKGFNNITYYWYINEKAKRTIRRYTNFYS